MKTAEVGIFDAKTKLSEIIENVEKGHVFYITKRGKRVAELRPVQPEKLPLTKGCAATPEYRMAPGFTATPEDFKNYI